MNWSVFGIVIIVMIVAVTAGFVTGVEHYFRKDLRSQLLEEVANTGTLKDVEGLAQKLGIDLLPLTGFHYSRGFLHQLVCPSSLGNFACSLLKAREKNPGFIQGVAWWLEHYYSTKQQKEFLEAMDRHAEIQQAVQKALEQALELEQKEERVAAAESEKEKKRKQQFRAWGVKSDTTPQQDK